jgi:hypothetical protein
MNYLFNLQDPAKARLQQASGTGSLKKGEKFTVNYLLFTL